MPTSKIGSPVVSAGVPVEDVLVESSALAEFESAVVDEVVVVVGALVSSDAES
jgi:hypothetical protein